jgi:RNA-dependent RNA polymerase
VKPEEKIVTGDVIVTKNLCSHPGDVRKLKAVDIKELNHLYNVVVYSTKGSRPD